jgi:hypothetical protein
MVIVRRALDGQMNSKSNAEQREREENRMYYQRLAEQAEEQRQREEKERQHRFLTRKNVDEQNGHKLGNRSRIHDGDTGYHLEIGVQSEKEHEQKASRFRREMMDTLDIQLKQKDEEQKMSKIRNQELEEEHKRMQENFFRPQERKQYAQNQRIYDYYQQIDRQRALKAQDLDHKLVDEAKVRQERTELERERQEHSKKEHNKEIVKETLGQHLQ